MIYICSECGSQIDEDSDFCHACGCLKSKAMLMQGPGAPEEGICPRCGAPISKSEVVCSRCFSPQQAAPAMRFDRASSLALFLAMIPGFFSIFGLGHLVLKEWIRGCMFLAMSGIYWYMRLTSGNSLALVLVSVALYIYQAVDLLRVMVARSLGR